MQFFSVEILLTIYLNFLLFAGAFIKAYYSQQEQRYAIFFYNLSLIFLFCLLVLLLLDISAGYYLPSLSFYSLYSITYSTQVVKFVIVFSTLFVLLCSIDYLKKEGLLSLEYLMLVFFSLLGMFVITSASDFMVLYMGLELQGLCFYVLATYDVGSLRSTESGLKYFLIGAFASILILFGVVLQYYFAGSTSYSAFHIINDGTYSFYSILSVLFIVIGFCFKLAAAPFHVWIADVYEGAPTSVTAFFAIVPKIVLISVLVFNLGSVVFSNSVVINSVFSISLLSILVGSFAALYQVSIKRLVAYSAVAHMGFMFLSISLGSDSSLLFLFLYLFVYIIISVGFFSALLSLRNYVNFAEFTLLKDLQGLYRSNPVLSLLFILNSFSLVGVPPLAGFFGKAFVLFSAVELNFIAVSLLFVFLSVVTAFYYLRLIKLSVYETRPIWIFMVPAGRLSAYSIAFFALLNLFFLCYSSELMIVLSYFLV